MEENYKNNYKSKILKKLDNYPFGLTIKEIAEKIGYHRNTVSKYVAILEAEGLIKKKKISAASVYSSKKRKSLPRNLVNSFFQALLVELKNLLPDKEKIFKEAGKKMMEHFQYPIGDTIFKEFEKAKQISDPQVHLKVFKKFYNYFDFFQEDVKISIVEIQNKKILYRISNSEYLGNTNNFIYFYYIACGVTEGIHLQILNKKIICNIERVHISNNKEDSFIEISIELKD
ncbi:MAG: HTH domain-containing protein [Promethearchaeota archaeon]